MVSGMPCFLRRAVVNFCSPFYGMPFAWSLLDKFHEQNALTL
jgi:hypothetical protein